MLQEEILIGVKGRKEQGRTVMRRTSCGIYRGSDSPAKAEESQVQAQQSCHHMPDEGTGFSGVEVNSKPHGHQQGKQLTCYKVNLHREAHKTSMNVLLTF